MATQDFAEQGWFEFNGEMYYDGQTGSLNHLYGYANQNPVNWHDWNGLAPGQGGRGRSKSAPGGSGSVGDQMSGPNGNVWSGYTPQDWRCSGPACVFNPFPSMVKRCIKHDACYQKNKCNWSSWISGAAGGTKSCNQCNSDF